MTTRLLSAVVAAGLAAGLGQTGSNDGWTRDFNVERGELASTGRNPYFILEPGYTLVLQDASTQLTVTVLNETKTVDGVDTRIVEERESKNGQPVEVSRNFFAISTRTNSVYYFGEDVDMYSNGKVTGHEGSWTAGEKGAQFGLMIPGLPLLKARYYQELAPGIAMDRAEVISLTESLTTPAGRFTNVLKTTESTPLESFSKEDKFYARGIGLIQDGSLKLTKYSK